MRPCQGRDRGFESRRDRQSHRASLPGVFHLAAFFFLSLKQPDRDLDLAGIIDPLPPVGTRSTRLPSSPASIKLPWQRNIRTFHARLLPVESRKNIDISLPAGS